MSSTPDPASAVSPSHASAATTGELHALPASPAHRVYVDGKVVGESGAIVTLPCGEHMARIGSNGKTRAITVPCGGSAEIVTR